MAPNRWIGLTTWWGSFGDIIAVLCSKPGQVRVENEARGDWQGLDLLIKEVVSGFVGHWTLREKADVSEV